MVRFSAEQKRKLEELYDLALGCLRPDYQRIADANCVRRDPVTGEISWPPHSFEDELRRAGLV